MINLDDKNLYGALINPNYSENVGKIEDMKEYNENFLRNYNTLLDFINENDISVSMVLSRELSQFLYKNDAKALKKIIDLLERSKLEIIATTPNNEFLYGISPNNYMNLMQNEPYVLPFDKDNESINEEFSNMHPRGFYSQGGYLSEEIIDVIQDNGFFYTFVPRTSLPEQIVKETKSNIATTLSGLILFSTQQFSDRYNQDESEMKSKINVVEVNRQNLNDFYSYYEENKDQYNFLTLSKISQVAMRIPYLLSELINDEYFYSQYVKASSKESLKESLISGKSNTHLDEQLDNMSLQSNHKQYNRQSNIIHYQFFKMRDLVNQIKERYDLENILVEHKIITGELMTKYKDLSEHARLFNDYEFIKKIEGMTKSDSQMITETRERIKQIYGSELEELILARDKFVQIIPPSLEDKRLKDEARYYPNIKSDLRECFVGA